MLNNSNDQYPKVKELSEVYQGLAKEEAQKLAEERGERLRSFAIDGNFQVITQDLRGDRVNANLVDGKIEAIYGWVDPASKQVLTHW